jgi:hypothetical protein
MHSRPITDVALDGMRVAYRPVSEHIRPTQLGIARLKRTRPRQMATVFGEFCRDYLSTKSPMVLQPTVTPRRAAGRKRGGQRSASA